MNRRSFLGVAGAAVSTAAVRPRAPAPAAFGAFDMNAYLSLNGTDREAIDKWTAQQAGSYERVFLLHLRGQPGAIETVEAFRAAHGSNPVTSSTHVVTEQPPAALASGIVWMTTEEHQ